MIKPDVSNKENVPPTWQSSGKEHTWTIPERPKTKEKTRATRHNSADTITTNTNNSTPSPPETPPPTILPVSPASLAVFLKILPARLSPDSTVDATTTKGQVLWHVFVKATTDAQFAVTNCGGSMVGFSKPGGGIIFHRPHPIAKLSKVDLLAMGKRMTRHFGWERGLFVDETEVLANEENA